ncbi:MAG: hypothetical protein KAT17_00485 [Candidatus Aminicenantes bacterium]|nr:hypothetical protein [Candidatus Aminicenantes bacterium]
MRTVSSIGLRGEIDFLRRHNNRDISRQKKIRRIKIKGLHLFFLCAILSGIGLSIFLSAKFLLTWDKLNISTVKLINSPRYGKEKVKRLLPYFRGNILSLSFDYIRMEMLRINEVKDVSISRVLPSTIELHFTLRKPIFQVFMNKQFYFMDVDGVTLYSSAKMRNDLMTIKNVKRSDLETITPYLPELSKIKKSIDYIGYKQPYGVMLKLKGMSEEFYPGEKNYVDKINYFIKIRKRLALNSNKIKRVDLRFENRFYLEFDKEVVN